MLKKELFSHYLVTLVWLVGLVVLRVVFTAGAFSTLTQFGAWIFFCGGSFLGTMLLDIDQIIFALIVYPEEKAKELWQKHQLGKLLEYLADTYQGRIKLPFHNVLFQVFFQVFCFWVLTSSASWFGRGLAMAMTLHLLKDELELLLSGDENRLRTWLFWPIKREVSFSEQKTFVILMLLVFLGLNLLLS